MRHIVIAAMLFSGCATVDSSVQKRAAVSGQATFFLKNCIRFAHRHQIPSEFEILRCHAEAEARCVEGGLEKSCADLTGWQNSSRLFR